MQAQTIARPLQEIMLSVRGTVSTPDCGGVLRGHRESLPPEVFLRNTPATVADAALKALARGVAWQDWLHLAHVIACRPGATHAHTTAAATPALGEGAFQDHALIACARVHGIQARHVSGYLPAAHAWSELQVSGLGSVGFHPANRCCPDLCGGPPERLDVGVAVLAGAQ